MTLLALVAIAIGVLVAYRIGKLRGRNEGRLLDSLPAVRAPAGPPLPPDTSPMETTISGTSIEDDEATRSADEPMQPVPGAEVETARLSAVLAAAEAELVQLRAFAQDRRALYRTLANARAETARYRQIVVDIENNAPPPLLDSPHAPDDLKLIVGVGPVLERMLQQLGIGSYRQIARWSERDVDEFEARLNEFPGRIRRDGWVTQARALHQSKYGDNPKDRG